MVIALIVTEEGACRTLRATRLMIRSATAAGKPFMHWHKWNGLLVAGESYEPSQRVCNRIYELSAPGFRDNDPVVVHDEWVRKLTALNFLHVNQEPSYVARRNGAEDDDFVSIISLGIQESSTFFVIICNGTRTLDQYPPVDTIPFIVNIISCNSTLCGACT